MRYILNLAVDNRILSAGKMLKGGRYEGVPVVDTLPDGDVRDYKYVNGEYVYEPLPVEPDPESQSGDEVTTDDMAAAILEGVNAV